MVILDKLTELAERKIPFKLEKLRIKAYKDRERKTLHKTFKVMFNPTSFSMNHHNVFRQKQGINTSGSQTGYIQSRSDRLSLDLVFDGTLGLSGLYTVLKGFGKGVVSKQIDKFLELCFHMDGDIHEPKFLKIQWGEGPLQNFDCRLESADIKYVSFDKNGAPLRAELSTVFIEDAKQVEKRYPSLALQGNLRIAGVLPQGGPGQQTG